MNFVNATLKNIVIIAIIKHPMRNEAQWQKCLASNIFPMQKLKLIKL